MSEISHDNIVSIHAHNHTLSKSFYKPHYHGFGLSNLFLNMKPTTNSQFPFHHTNIVNIYFHKLNMRERERESYSRSKYVHKNWTTTNNTITFALQRNTGGPQLHKPVSRIEPDFKVLQIKSEKLK